MNKITWKRGVIQANGVPAGEVKLFGGNWIASCWLTEGVSNHSERQYAVLHLENIVRCFKAKVADS